MLSFCNYCNWEQCDYNIYAYTYMVGGSPMHYICIHKSGPGEVGAGEYAWCMCTTHAYRISGQHDQLALASYWVWWACHAANTHCQIDSGGGVILTLFIVYYHYQSIMYIPNRKMMNAQQCLCMYFDQCVLLRPVLWCHWDYVTPIAFTIKINHVSNLAIPQVMNNIIFLPRCEKFN